MLHHDLNYGLRMLIRRPGFTAVAVITLALGIGANTAIFSFANALFFQRPGLVGQPEQMATVIGFREGRLGSYWLSYPDYVDYRDRNSVFEDLAAKAQVWLFLSSGNGSSEVDGCGVSSNYFSVLGIKPLLGRFFLPEDDSTAGEHSVAVLSYQIWQSQFGGDPDIVGKSIRMNRVLFTVIGVAPEGFRGLYTASPEKLWVPSVMAGRDKAPRASSPLLNRANAWFDLIGRLKPASTIEQARSELVAIAGQLEAAYPDTNKNLSVYLAPVKGIYPFARDKELEQSSLLMAVVVCLLLIACANLAGLLLARGAERRKEIAIRLALGASRFRLVRQLLTESLILAVAGGVAGLILAAWANDLIATFYAYHFRELELRLDPLVLGYALGLSIVTGLVFGLAPALEATRFNLVPALKDSGVASGYRQSRLRASLVVAQVAISLVLLAGAGLLIQSLRSLLASPRYDQSGIAQFRLRPSRLGYNIEKAQAYHRELIRRLETQPGVQSIFLARVPPGRDWGWAAVSLPGQAPRRPEDAFRVESNEVTPRFFETLKISLLNGRAFDEGDRGGAPLVAIVNETLARRLWPQDDPVGMPLVIDRKEYRVIGVAQDTQPRRSDEQPRPYVYRAYWQSKEVDSRAFVRVAGDPRAMLLSLRQEIAAVDPDVHIGQEMSLAERTALSFESERLMGNVLSYAGAIALFLSVLGLYGVLAQAVSQRTREIGIRMALGAQVNDVLMMVVSQGLKLAFIGIAIGLALALALTRVLSSYLYGITPRDPLTFVVVALLLAGVALVACYFPARRATKVDPMVALRYE
jgi:putative ABC transport system permease protein